MDHVSAPQKRSRESRTGRPTDPIGPAIFTVLVPVAAYVGLHLLGRRYPETLWGVDQLYYYSTSVTLMYLGITALAIALGFSHSLTGRFDSCLEHSATLLRRSPWLRALASAVAGLPLASAM